ncbi:SusC/RagA family TonB-linked outer membrane protein, partial [uncultured Duncaniella sp.]
DGTNMLDEVITVAYGTAKKSSFTGAASTISGATIEKLQVSNVSKALEGAAPGVQVALQSGQPGTSGTVRIRGIGSINSSAAPLYVVDGMPFDGDLASINPNDIESMSVLKDAASTALYGSRAANGVIVITTKKGKEQRSRVTVDARIGSNSRGISNYDIMTDAGMYMLTNWNLLKNQTSAENATAKLIDRVGYNPYDCANDAVVDVNGNLTNARLLWNDNWTDEAIKNGLRQEYNVTVSGGNEKSNHFLSMGYLEDEGIIKNSDYSRLSFRASGDYDVNRWINVSGNIAYSRGEQNALQISSLSNYSNTFAFIQQMGPIYPVFAYDRQGNRIYGENGKAIYDFGDGQYGVRPYFSNQNVVASDDANQNRYIRDNISSRFGLTLKIIDGLQFRANLGYDVTNTSRDQFMTPDFGDAQQVDGRAYKTRQRNETYTINELLSYEKNFGEKHHFDILAGHETYKMNLNYLYGAKSHFFEPTIPEFDNAITMDDLSSSTDEYTIESWLGRLNYDFDDKYYLSASLRSDGSSRFAKGHRWGTFWSVGGSWRISKENFMQDLTWLDNMSIRASYGSVGNDDIYYPNTSSSNYYPALTQYQLTNAGGSYSLSRYYQGNPNITWETSYNFNVGFTAQLLNNLLNVDFEYFNKRTEDMLYNVPQSPSSGVSYISENALTMNNKGIEFTLGVNIPMPKDFTWNWTFTGTHYVNKVTDIPADKRKDGITHGGYYNIREGRSVWDFYYYKFAGLDETGHSTWWADVKDEDGNITGREAVSDYSAATKYYIGTAIPDFIGGITTNFTWKGIDFSVAMNYQIGGDIYDGMYANLMGSSNAGQNWHKDILNAWTPENTNTNVPVLDGDQNANTFSDKFLIGADFFNLRNITLGYSFPSKWLSKANIERARIYMNADNVALWSKRKGMDPRQYISGESAANYSTIRTLSFGLSLTF